MTNTYKESGLSLLELLVVVAIIALIVTIGAPVVVDTQRTMKLKGAVESSYFALQQARSSAISLGADVTVKFIEGTNWCIGLNDGGDCDCNVANSCTINGVEQSIKASDYSQVSMQELNFGENDMAIFDGVRGLSMGNSGTTVLTDGIIEARLVLNDMGRVSVCIEEGTLGTYAIC